MFNWADMAYRQSTTTGESKLLDGVLVESSLREDVDGRRAMVEVFSSPELTIRDVKFLDILPQDDGGKVVIGGHWEKGVEIQYLLSGRIAQLDLADVATGEKRTVTDIPAGSRVTLPAGVAHRLIFC